MKKNVLSILFFFILPVSWASAQCVGSQTQVSLPRNIGCSAGLGNSITWDGASGGTLTNQTDYGVTVTWTTTGTFRLTRTFPSGCSGTPLYSSYYTISNKPSAPTSGQVNQQVGCGTVTLNYTGSVYGTYWQTTSTGTSETYRTTMNVTATGTYYARIKGSATCWSDPVSISVTTVNATVLPGSINGEQTICSGSAPATLNNNSSPTGGTGTYTYQWQHSSDGSAWSSAPGTSTNATYNPPSLTSSTYYRRIVTSCTVGYSNNVLVTVSSPTVGGSISGGTEAYGAASGNLTLSGHTGNVVKWQKKEGTGSWTDITSTSNSYAYTNVLTTTSYRAVVKSGACAGQNSTQANVTIYAVPSITLSGEAALSPGGSVSIITDNGLYSYEWTKNGTVIPGANTRTLVVTQPGTYRLKAKSTATSPVYESGDIIITSVLQASDRNRIIVTDYQKAGITPSTDPFSLQAGEFSTTIQYFDGLGRPMQTVSIGSSPLGHDMIQPVVYDNFGREAKKYLPYAHTSRSGLYRANALTAQAGFYGAGGEVASDTHPYAETVFEASPLNRPDKDFGAGAAWHTNNKFIQHGYLINQHGTGAGQEKVIAWIVSSSNKPARATVLTSYVEEGGYYSTGQLSIKSTKDEHGNAVREYTDKTGRVVLKKVQVTTAGASNLNDLTGTTPGWALTYYVYDDLGNLRFVLPPELSKLLHTNADNYVITTTDLNNWAFQYNYDARKRMTTKRVPGAGEVYMVYDHRDRLVLTQDANQRSTTPKYWSFTKYDELNRPILTGIKDTTASLTQAAMQDVVNNFYSNMSTTTWRAWSEKYIGSTAGNVHGYTNKAYPVRTGAASEIDANKYLTVTYYDNYDFRSLWSGPYAYADENLSETAQGVLYSQPDNENTRVIGQVTGTKTKVLDGGKTGGYTWLKSITYYDDKYRVIQVQTDNYKGGMDRVTNLVDFTGKVLETTTTHQPGIVWKDKVAVNWSGNKLSSTIAGWGNSGAASVQQLAAGVDGWVEMTAVGSYNRMFGLSASNVDAGTSINFAFYLNGQNLRVYEGGTLKTTISGTLVDGEVLRIERTGTTVKYKRNGVVVYTSATASGSSLMVDVAFNNIGGVLVNPRISFGDNQRITRRFEYDHTGRLTHTWHKLNSGNEILLAKNEYNELGQLIDKKLHSTVSNGSDAKQSIDYRYNIRGWLTKMNDAALSDNTESRRDLFGMNLEYNTNELGLTTEAQKQFNGNISAIAWSNYLGGSDVKQKGYVYSYDPLNRISTSTFKQKEANWSTLSNSGFSETDFSYDLNGNITALKRNDGRSSGLMDNLTYTYTHSTEGTSNKLRKVTDAGDPYKGFIDGYTGGNSDYTYDENGNMITDRNKGITSAIAYNYLNLPELITRGSGNTLRYIYDATGRKVSQVATHGGQSKQTDYAGEFQYEDDQLLFISHEEGRIVTQKTKSVYATDGSSLAGIVGNSGTGGLASLVTLNGETYIKVAYTGSAVRSGITINGTMAVQPGERYLLRAKGYSGTTPVNFLVRVNTTIDMGLGSALPNSSQAESWVEQYVTMPAGATTLKVSLVWHPVATGQEFFVNDIEIIKLETQNPEYQYNLKDHLGNVRLTFTTTPPPDDVYTGTLEDANSTAETATFSPSYGTAVRVSSSLYNHTPGGAKSQRLSAANQNEVIGLTKSLRVVPGDTIDMKVYAKYTAPTTTSTNIGSLILPAISAAFGVSASSPGDPGTLYQALNTLNTAGALLQSGDDVDQNVPKAFLNFILFNDDYKPYDAGFTQISEAALENGSNIAHEVLQLQAAVTQPGYLYIYLSNENDEVVDVFFDDLTITHQHGPVIQQDDYYAFGLTFNSYSRENSVKNRIKFQGQEHIDDLDLGWDQFKWRNHMPDIGRFFNVDPLASDYAYNSPYAFCENQVTTFFELEGLEKGGRASSYNNRPVVRSGGNPVTISQAISRAARIANRPPGFATITARENAYFKRTTRYSFGRGGGNSANSANSYGRDSNVGDESNVDHSHSFGNRSGNSLKVALDIADNARNIINAANEIRKVEFFSPEGFYLGFDLIVGDESTTAQLNQLDQAFIQAVFASAMDGMSQVKWEGLNQGERLLRLSQAFLAAGASPSQMAAERLKQGTQIGKPEDKNVPLIMPKEWQLRQQ